LLADVTIPAPNLMASIWYPRTRTALISVLSDDGAVPAARREYVRYTFDFADRERPVKVTLPVLEQGDVASRLTGASQVASATSPTRSIDPAPSPTPSSPAPVVTCRVIPDVRSNPGVDVGAHAWAGITVTVDAPLSA